MAMIPGEEHFTILYFASAASFTQKTAEQLPAPLKADKLFDVLEERYPGMRRKILASCAVTVNMDYVEVEQVASSDAETASSAVIKAGDEVGIIPPVSSG